MAEEKKSRYSKPRTRGLTFDNAKYCCFTAWVDKHAEGWAPEYEAKTMNYLVYQLEECPETKRRHYQGYVEFKKSTRLNTARKALGINEGGWHAQNRIGSAEQARTYCTKEDSRLEEPQEFGEMSTPPGHKGAGHRTDLSKVSSDIKSGMSLKKIALENPDEYIKYHNGIEKLHAFATEPVAPEIQIELRPWQQQSIDIIERGYVKRQILWIWSHASETGKSTFKDYVTGRYGLDSVLMGSMKWIDTLYAYNNHKVIWFDFPRDHVLHETDFKVLEEVSDGGMKLSTKYVPKQKLLRSVIICTANQPPPVKRLPKRFIEINIDSPKRIERTQVHEMLGL